MNKDEIEFESHGLDADDITHGLLVVEHDDLIKKTGNYGVIHFIGYNSEPTTQTYIDAYKELKKEFGMGKGIVLIPADADAVAHFKNLEENDEE